MNSSRKSQLIHGRILKAIFLGIVLMALLGTQARADERFSHVKHGWLGVSVRDLTPDLAKYFGLENPKGALISDVFRGGPAYKADIKRGDVIINYIGKKIPDASALRDEVSVTPVGKVVGITLWRNGKKQKVLVRIGNFENAVRIHVSSINAHLGVDVRPVTSREVEKYGLNSRQGVAIVWLDPNGPLTTAGFEVNDLILGINGQAIEGLKSFVDRMSALRPQQRIILLALDHRSGRRGYVQVIAY